MNTITKAEFLSLCLLNHFEVLTTEQMKRNTEVIGTYIQKSRTAELDEFEKAQSNALINDVSMFECWCVLRDDFSKAIVYTRPEQVTWTDAERGEFGEIVKAKSGVYKPTAENKKLGRVGQKYGEQKESGNIEENRAGGELPGGLKVGDEIIVQEPTQHFSHDVYIVRGFKNGKFQFETANGDEHDGRTINFPLNLFKRSKVKMLKSK